MAKSEKAKGNVTLMKKVGRADWQPVASYDSDDPDLEMKMNGDKQEEYRKHRMSGSGSVVEFKEQ